MKNRLTILLLLLPLLAFCQKLEPTKTEALLIVKVINSKNQIQRGESVSFVGKKSGKSFSGVTNDKGVFEVLVPKGDTYNIKYKSFTSDADYTSLEVPSEEDDLMSFEVTVQFELPKRYTLDNVYFDSGKTTITKSSFSELDELVHFLNMKKDLKIEIGGHTDNVGVPENNLTLSQQRADAVRDYLIKKGINGGRLVAKGYGDSRPIASNDTEAGKKKNRRTEVRLIK